MLNLGYQKEHLRTFRHNVSQKYNGSTERMDTDVFSIGYKCDLAKNAMAKVGVNNTQVYSLQKAQKLLNHVTIESKQFHHSPV